MAKTVYFERVYLGSVAVALAATLAHALYGFHIIVPIRYPSDSACWNHFNLTLTLRSHDLIEIAEIEKRQRARLKPFSHDAKFPFSRSGADEIVHYSIQKNGFEDLQRFTDCPPVEEKIRHFRVSQIKLPLSHKKFFCNFCFALN